MTANVCKVAMLWTIAPREVPPTPSGGITDVVTTFHAHAIDSHAAPDADDRAALAAVTLAWWQDDGDTADRLRAAYPTTVSLTGVQVWNVKPAASGPDEFVNLFPAGTNAAANHLPPQCAYLVGLRTTVDERTSRGRMYLPAFASSVFLPEWNTGRVVPDQQETIGRYAAELARRIGLLEGGPGVWALAVYSRKLADSLAVTHFAIPDVIATQRRRAFTPAGHLAIGLDGEPA